MTYGQFEKLQDLKKCYMPSYSFERIWVDALWHDGSYRLNKIEKGFLRKYTHLYRHQIKAMRRNRK